MILYTLKGSPFGLCKPATILFDNWCSIMNTDGSKLLKVADRWHQVFYVSTQAFAQNVQPSTIFGLLFSL